MTTCVSVYVHMYHWMCVGRLDIAIVLWCCLCSCKIILMCTRTYIVYTCIIGRVSRDIVIVVCVTPCTSVCVCVRMCTYIRMRTYPCAARHWVWSTPCTRVSVVCVCTYASMCAERQITCVVPPFPVSIPFPPSVTGALLGTTSLFLFVETIAVTMATSTYACWRVSRHG